MHRLLYILAIILTGSAFAGPLSEPSYYVNSRAVILSYESANYAKRDNVRVWVSTDNIQTWQKAAIATTGLNMVQFNAPGDGNYSFYIVLENKDGRSAPAPTKGAKPHLNVAVDTSPPTLQIHSARLSTLRDGSPLLHLNVSLIDENLGDAGTRLFYRANAELNWQDAGPVTHAAGVINWRPPPDIPSRIDIRIAATDLAGNRTVDEIRDINIEQFTSDQPPLATNTKNGGLEPVTIPRVEPVKIAPIQPVTLDGDPEHTPATQPALQDNKQSELLRSQAASFLSQGRLSLAGARLQDALELTPDNPDLHVDFGSILFRARQYDQAAGRFQRALETSPNHLGAIEGLALVAVNQKRYPEARSHLEHMLKLHPNVAEHWMHLGDVEHMLGNVVDARADWEKALQIEPADETIRKEAQKRLRLFGQK